MKAKIKIDRLLLISKLEEVMTKRNDEYSKVVADYDAAMEALRKKLLVNLKKIVASEDLSGLDIQGGNPVFISTGIFAEVPTHPSRDYQYRYYTPEDIRKKIELLKLSSEITILVSTDDEYYQYL